ncbi:cupin domain-containing protein [Nocardia seriolae]|uniref:Cupin type-2 domain-containing protein n=1 Tax=Nocardia seriolae TaxID=37332 RepID=A0A0B8NBM8_9NOCA|nr:cupin domain-containing protein [Nocardia seriolae]MTJ64023.1 cupin domain-containing protein [Nocardia seriolae]MTJ71309.1 cupin domain-containing protein [Nocardia seriolae]MTJ88584.1 cupin domain-containing protein [Nocardia seriolae]MTK32568.1 cupin domain-containing protein [Nocardia seriolae]MTK41909.1 cupin domain-containing protein [Nocardia seriolae]
MNTTTRTAAIRQPQDAEIIGGDPVSVRLLIDSNEAGGSVSTVEVTMARGADGATPHYHTLSDELFYVADGELQVMAGEKIVTVGAGGTIVVPKFMPHAFGAAPDSPARILIALMPGVERHGYFRFLERLATGRTTPAEFDAAQQDYDNHFIEAPRWWAERNANRA